ARRRGRGDLVAGGRPRPAAGPGPQFAVPAEGAVIAAGTAPTPTLARTPGLTTSERGTIVVDDATGRTSRTGVFAGGDIVTGGATVILAMGAGRRAATAIHEYLSAPSAAPAVVDSADGARVPRTSEPLGSGSRSNPGVDP